MKPEEKPMSVDVKGKVRKAQERASRLQQLSDAAGQAKSKRDECLYRWFEDLWDTVVSLRKLSAGKRRKILGNGYNVFRSLENQTSLIVRIMGPNLSVKKRAKYAAILRFVMTKMDSDDSAGEFIRRNGGTNACAKAKKHHKKTNV
jgi:hypothetical protein